MEIQVEKICANCRHYGFKPNDGSSGEFETWAFCGFYQVHFPNARGWLPHIAEKINAQRAENRLPPAVFKKPGERTCSKFEY